MKGLFRKIFKKDKGENANSAAQSEETKTAEVPPFPQQTRICQNDQHLDMPFKCLNDHCQNQICTKCATPNKNNDILCQLCTLSEMNFGGDSGSSGDEAFTGGSMTLEARVSFDPKNKSVVGWDSIWAIIDAEEKDKNDLIAKLNAGVGKFVEDQRASERLKDGKEKIVPVEEDRDQ